MLKKDKELKLYYSIKEVAQQLGVNESTLRYWEKEFPQLKPKTQALNKVRQYTAEDMELLRRYTIWSRCVASSSPPPARCSTKTAGAPTAAARCSRRSSPCARSCRS